jgi:transcriptional regulator of acetoin/glycerol metabolism
MEHAFVLCRGRMITMDDLPSEIREYGKKKPLTSERKAARGPEAVLEALNRTDWNKAKASRLLGVSRQTIYRNIEKYGLIRPSDSGK